MTNLRHHFRLTLLALAAVAGTLLVVGDASASSAAGASSKSGRSCCLNRVCTVCCCKPAPHSSPVRLTSAAMASDRGALSAAAVPCECRSSEPNAPAPRPESRPSQGRPDRARGESIAVAIEVPLAAVTFARLVPPTNRPPESPLYLRNARLLI